VSTRIYNGTRFRGARPDIMARKLAQVVGPIHEQLVIEAVAALVHAKIRQQLTDQPALATDPPADEALDVTNPTAFLSWVDKVIETTSKCDWRMSSRFSLEMSVAFASDPDDDAYCYAAAFASHPRLSDAWTQLPGVQTFAYWDNTDGPSEVHQTDWDARRLIWKRVLGPQPWSTIGVCWEAQIPSALIMFTLGPVSFLRRVEAQVERIENERREQLVLRRDPENMDRKARAIAHSLRRQYTATDLAAEWDNEESVERALFQ